MREELEVLHYQQLVNARGMLFPGEDPFPEQNLAALTPESSTDIDIHKELGKDRTPAARRRSSAGRHQSAKLAAATLNSSRHRPSLSKRASAFTSED